MKHRAVHLSANDAREVDGYLTTRGRQSGTRHEVEIWFAATPDNRTLYVMSGGRERADWVKNRCTSPSVHFRIRSVTYSGTARLIEGNPEERPAREALAAKYYGWRGGEFPNEWCRTALPIAIDLGGIVAS